MSAANSAKSGLAVCAQLALGNTQPATYSATFVLELRVTLPHSPVSLVSIETLVQFNAAWNRHDIEALMGFMAADCVFHGVAGPDLLGRSFVGREAVREGFMLAWQNFPDAQWLDGDHFVQGDRGVSESTFSGTRADGMRVEARMVDVFTFKDGKIAVKNAYRKDRPAFKP